MAQPMAAARGETHKRVSVFAPTIPGLPSGYTGLPRELVEASQRQRLLHGVTAAVADQGYGPTTVAAIEELFVEQKRISGRGRLLAAASTALTAVYDADSGLCVLANVPYKVLNGGCNEFYGSGERPFGTQAAPDCFGTKPPWMTPSPKP